MFFRFQLGIHAFKLGELCFQTLGAMLSDSQSNAFRLSKHCFQNARALLLDSQSIALDYKEHISGPYGAMLPMLRSMPLNTYRALLPMVWSSALMSIKICARAIIPR